MKGRFMMLWVLAIFVIPLLMGAVFSYRWDSFGKLSQRKDPMTRGSVMVRKDLGERIFVDFQSGDCRELPLDDYLVCVLLAEMPADFEPEALKAQAVVARTYTLKHSTLQKHTGGALCTDPACCQAYCDPDTF